MSSAVRAKVRLADIVVSHKKLTSLVYTDQVLRIKSTESTEKMITGSSSDPCYVKKHHFVFFEHSARYIDCQLLLLELTSAIVILSFKKTNCNLGTWLIT